MVIDMYTTEKGGKSTVPHDLNFAQNEYENIHTVQFKNPSQALQAILRETGPLPADEDRKRKAQLDGAAGKKKKPFDVEKMADALVKLDENDLLQVIQMIHDHKSDDTYIQNNVEGKRPKKTRIVLRQAGRVMTRTHPPPPPRPFPLPELYKTICQVCGQPWGKCSKNAIAGEFSVDLFTISDNLGKMLWEYLVR